MSNGGHHRPWSPPVLGMQKWEGHVLDVDEELLTVQLVPLDHEGPTLVADFKQSLLAPHEDVAPGDVVYLTVRTVRDRLGYRSEIANLRLRRLGNMSKAEIDATLDSARRLAASLEQYAE